MNMFRKEGTEPAKQAAPKRADSPYLAARREWMERYGDYVQAAYHWRLAACAFFFVAMFAVGGMVYSSSQNHFIPYVVEVDKLGYAVAAGPANAASPADTRIIRAQIAHWMVNVRSVYVDAAAERQAIEDAYALIAHASAAYNYVNGIFEKQSPFERASKETVTVEVHAVLQETKDTWRVEWKENTYERTGELRKSEEWQAVLSLVVAPSDNEQTLLKNPTGIYIQSLDWSKKL